jgi:2-amino-4-hydroxy-6-hydroxymethyldihydropteridine diphosphokinase
MPYIRAYLSLGSNLGDRKVYLRQAIQKLDSNSEIILVNISNMYETAPWGVTDQPAFLNLCVALDTKLAPRALLDLCLAIEKTAGRERIQRWGPRTLDMDILIYGDKKIDEDGLIIPHPAMLDRSFVLKPLLDIAPDLILSGVNLTRRLTELGEAGIMNMGALPE